MKRIIWSFLTGGLLMGCQTTSEPTITDILRQTSNDMNKTTPLMVDSETRLDSTYVLPNKFGYKYTLVTYEVANLDVPKFTSIMQGQVTSIVCTSPDMKVFVNNNIDVGYSYYDKDNKYITEAVVKVAECE